MRQIKLGLIPFLIFCCIALLPAQKRMSVYIEEVLAIGDKFSDLIYQRPSLTTDNEGNIYITDSENNSIKKFSKNGELIKEVARIGEKSEEFRGPHLIKYYNGKLYVTEIYRPGIQVFDKNLEFESRIPIPFTMTDLNIISRSQFAVSALKYDWFEGNFVSCIYIYDSKGEEQEKIIYSRDTNFTMMNMINFLRDRRNNFFIVYTWKDKIERIDRSGKLLWTKSLLGEQKVKKRTEKDTKPTFGEYPVEAAYKSVASDTRGNFFILGGHLSENSCRDVYVLSKNGQHLTTITLPEASHAIHIDRDNFLYSRSDKGITLRKFALKYFYD